MSVQVSHEVSLYGQQWDQSIELTHLSAASTIIFDTSEGIKHDLSFVVHLDACGRHASISFRLHSDGFILIGDEICNIPQSEIDQSRVAVERGHPLVVVTSRSASEGVSGRHLHRLEDFLCRRILVVDVGATRVGSFFTTFIFTLTVRAFRRRRRGLCDFDTQAYAQTLRHFIVADIHG